MSLRLILVVLAAVVGAVATIVFVSRGSGDNAAATPTPPSLIQGPQVRIGDLIYNVTDMRILKLNRPLDAPYLVNLPPPPKNDAYIGVFLKIYNLNPHQAEVSAPGFLLEPMLNSSLDAQNQSSESPYALDQGGAVPPGSQLPLPGSASAAGPIPGALLLYVISGPMTKAQPFRLVVHTGLHTDYIMLPHVTNLSGNGH